MVKEAQRLLIKTRDLIAGFSRNKPVVDCANAIALIYSHFVSMSLRLHFNHCIEMPLGDFEGPH